MHRLDCAVQKYSWGRRGSESKVALFKAASNDSFTINENECYAELWMGTHSNGPSKLLESKDGMQGTLSEYLKLKKDLALGESISKHFYSNESDFTYGDLPFLFKVLSINQALSIQAHPNKKLAKQLNSSDPKNYPDANHKPEMLIAISETFEAMCGFRVCTELFENFKNYAELVELCDKKNCEKFIELVANHSNESENGELEAALSVCFSSMMNKSETFINEQFEKLRTRLAQTESSKLSYQDNLFLRLAKQYPNDVGCFSIYLLNCIMLKKGEAIFLSANMPHAYLFGDGVECMACSDNVVRAGLTPKFKDIKTLCSMLDYRMRSIQENKLHASRTNLSLDKNYLLEYRPNVDEFSVQQIKIEQKHLNSNGNRFLLPKCNSGSILIIVEINSTKNYFELEESNVNVKKLEANLGYVYFIDANKDIYFVCDDASVCSNNNETILMAYRSYCDIKTSN